MGIWEGIERGARALFQGEEPASYLAGGQKVVCPHCKSEGFYERRALMNTFGMTLLNLDWANKEVTTLTCGRCGMIQWFGIKPERGTPMRERPEEGVDA